MRPSNDARRISMKRRWRIVCLACVYLFALTLAISLLSCLKCESWGSLGSSNDPAHNAESSFANFYGISYATFKSSNYRYTSQSFPKQDEFGVRTIHSSAVISASQPRMFDPRLTPNRGDRGLNVAGFGITLNHNTTNDPDYHAETILWQTSIPLPLILVFTGCPTYAYFSDRRRRRRALSRCCMHCGYDCRATPERCPECGTPGAITPAKSPDISAES